MATKSKEEKLQCLNCPMCLEVIMNATFLGCGHSFCRDCLEAYDNQHQDLNHIVCPVCRMTTKLDQERVAGLTPNFLAKGLEDILRVDVIPQSQEGDLSLTLCPSHSDVYKDIYCQSCSEFICLKCYFKSHQGHKFKKREELEKEFKTKRGALLQKSMTRRIHIEQCMSEAALQRDVMKSHLSGLEREVRVAFANKVATIQQNEEDLLEKIGSIRTDLDKQLESCIRRCTDVIDRISNSVKLLTHNATKSLYPDMIKADHLLYSDIEDSLKEASDEESITRAEEIGRNVQFCPAGDELLTLGCIDVGDNSSQNTTYGAGVSEEAGVPPASSLETKNATQHVNINGRRRKKKKKRVIKQQASRNATDIPGIPAALLNSSLSIVRARPFPLQAGVLFGLAALSEDAVVIGFAMNRTGCYRFTLTGGESQYVWREVGDVYDVAFLSGGRTVISKKGDEFYVYNSVSTSGKGMRYACKRSGEYVRVCTDQRDNIYAVNNQPEICVFHGSNPNPQRVVPTGDIRPQQICVTKTGIMITSTGDITPSTVTVFDQKGRVGTSIRAHHENEFVYATVDSFDRVLVATVVCGSDVMRLMRYRLQGIQLVEEVRFQHLRMPWPIQNIFLWPLQSSVLLHSLFYMVSLNPNTVAVATRHHLMFIQLGM